MSCAEDVPGEQLLKAKSQGAAYKPHKGMFRSMSGTPHLEVKTLKCNLSIFCLLFSGLVLENKSEGFAPREGRRCEGKAHEWMHFM
jgi:hypothetical protein